MRKSDYNGIVTFIGRFKVPKAKKNYMQQEDVDRVCMQFIQDKNPNPCGLTPKGQGKYRIVQANFTDFANWCVNNFEYTEDWKRIKSSNKCHTY